MPLSLNSIYSNLFPVPVKKSGAAPLVVTSKLRYQKNQLEKVEKKLH
jgi:hypothetical protein